MKLKDAQQRIAQLTQQRDALLEALERTVSVDSLSPQELAVARAAVMMTKAVIAATEGTR